MKEFNGLRAKTYSYSTDDSSGYKKAKNTKMCVIIRKFKLNDYKNCLEAIHFENETIHIEKKRLT